MTITDSLGTGGNAPASVCAEVGNIAVVDAETGIRVTAHHVKTSTRTDYAGAHDVAVFVVLPWASLFGEVTVAPDPPGSTALAAFGDEPGHWVSAMLLRSLISVLDPAAVTTVMDMLERAAVAAVEVAR